METSIGEGGELVLPAFERNRWGLAPGVQLMVRETQEGILIRPADPPLSRLYVEPTNRCNLSCRTCMRHSWSEAQGVMNLQLFRSLIDSLQQVSTLKSVSFWGFGEPLLHPDIAEMVALAKSLGVRTQLITNGLLLTRAVSERLVAAGLDSLVVSVDGASPHTHADIRSGADLRTVLHNVDELNEIRRTIPDEHPEVGIEFVAMRSNVGELPHLMSLAFRMGASFIVVTNLLPYTEEMKDEVLYGLRAGTCYPTFRTSGDPEILMPRIDLRPDVASAVGALLRYSSATGLPLQRPEGARGYCRFVGEGSAVVSWDGEVSPCVALMHGYRCYVIGKPKEIRRYSLGNVYRNDISEIWASDQFRSFRARVQKFDFSPCTDCGGCDLADRNEADCAGNSFPVCGDCLWAKGVIQCP